MFLGFQLYCVPTSNLKTCFLASNIFSCVEKHYSQIADQESPGEGEEAQELSTIRCYTLTTLVALFHTLCKANHSNWSLPSHPHSCDPTEALVPSRLAEPSPLKRRVDVKQNLKRLGQLSSLLINSLAALRCKGNGVQHTKKVDSTQKI